MRPSFPKIWFILTEGKAQDSESSGVVPGVQGPVPGAGSWGGRPDHAAPTGSGQADTHQGQNSLLFMLLLPVSIIFSEQTACEGSPGTVAAWPEWMA